MGETQVGSIAIVWGSSEESYGYVETLTLTDEANGREDIINENGDIVDAVYHGLRTTMTASLVALNAAHGLTVGGSVSIDGTDYWVDTATTTKIRAGLKTYDIAGWTSADIAP